jgi:phosphoglycolate phosphatase-like HAD superfamily hydrolase
MALRVAFDLDGTIADMESALSILARRLFSSDVGPETGGRQGPGEEAPPDVAAAGAELSEAVDQREAESVATRLSLSPRQQRELWRAATATENFWEGLNEIEPGAVEKLALLAGRRQWEVAFLTQRPSTAGDSVQLQTQRWLKRHGFPLPSVFVVSHGARGRVAAALDLQVVVDDRPENCLDVVLESKARAILVWRGGRSAVPASAQRLSIGVVESIAECLEILEQADMADRTSAGVLDWLKRKLGIGA